MPTARGSMSPNQIALLKFIRERYLQIPRPITVREIRLSHCIPDRFVTTTLAALMRKEMIWVREMGIAEYIPINLLLPCSGCAVPSDPITWRSLTWDGVTRDACPACHSDQDQLDTKIE